VVLSGEWWGDALTEWVGDGSAAFTGEYEHSVDEKGRLILPGRVREALGSTAYLVRGPDGCLLLYPEPRFLEIRSGIGRWSIAKQASRTLARTVFAAICCEPDKAGRILLPPGLRRYAGITNQAVLAGVDDHLEIWEPSRWEAAMDGLRDIGDGPDGTSASSGE